jgi:hypothetical protein
MNMKLEKLNIKQIALNNEAMNCITGGQINPGDTRFSYSGGTAAQWDAGNPSMDRMVQVYTFDPDCNCYAWENTGHGITRLDPVSPR